MSTRSPRRLSGAVEVQIDLAKAGFTKSFSQSGDALVCTESGRKYRPEDLTVVASYRFEGESNPDDMSVLYAIRSNGGDCGILVDAFGLYGDPSLAEVIARIPDERSSEDPESPAPLIH